MSNLQSGIDRDSNEHGRASRVHVLLADAEAERFDAYCKTKGYKKSTLVARLIREHLDREQFGMQQELFRTSPS